MRVISYRSPHVPSQGIVPYLVSMLTTSFGATWQQNDKHTSLEDRFFLCQYRALELKIGRHETQPPNQDMQYSDLVILANIILKFQQQFTMPGLVFSYLVGGQVYVLSKEFFPPSTRFLSHLICRMKPNPLNFDSNSQFPSRFRS